MRLHILLEVTQLVSDKARVKDTKLLLTILFYFPLRMFHSIVY